MALLNRFSRLNDRSDTGVFTFIVTKSVTRDFHRDATTKDFCFGYHRWAVSFQRPTEKVLGVHLLLRNPSPNSSCVVDFTLTLINRDHFSRNEVYTKRQAKFTVTNPMQGVSRWIQLSELIERRFSNETGEFLFELSLSNITTTFECDIQLNPSILSQYKSILRKGVQLGSGAETAELLPKSTGINKGSKMSSTNRRRSGCSTGSNSELISLETNYFTFGSFDWSLTIVPLALAPSQGEPKRGEDLEEQQPHLSQVENSSTSSSSSNANTVLATRPNTNSDHQQHHRSSSNSNLSIDSCSSTNNSARANNISLNSAEQCQQRLEPVCRVYLNRLNGFDNLCRVKYRVILGHHQVNSQHQTEFVDSMMLDQISDGNGRIRGHLFRNTNILKLISLRASANNHAGSGSSASKGLHLSSIHSNKQQNQQQHILSNATLASQTNSTSTSTASSCLDLRVHIEMFCANTVSQARVPLQRKLNEAPLRNCIDKSKQSWCIESDNEGENVRLKLFFMDLQLVPRNHIRYISWIAYLVRREVKSGTSRESLAVKNSPHSNFYLQDGMDTGVIMETGIPIKEVNNSPQTYLNGNQLTVHIEWIDSLLLFSHLYCNYDSMTTVQRHQISRELSALQTEFEHLERKYEEIQRNLSQLLGTGESETQQQQQQQERQYSPSSPQTSPGSALSLLSTSPNKPPRDQPPTGYAGRIDSLGSQLFGEQQAVAFGAGGSGVAEGGQALTMLASSGRHFAAVSASRDISLADSSLLLSNSPDSQSILGSPIHQTQARLSSRRALSALGAPLEHQQQQQHQQHHWAPSQEVALATGSRLQSRQPDKNYSSSHNKPMSYGDRLKFSSSTPPNAELALQQASQPSEPMAALRRRILPQQPPPSSSSQPMRVSPPADTHFGRQQCAAEASKPAAANNFAGAAESIKGQHQAAKPQRGQVAAPSKLLMEESVQAETEQVDRYHHGALNSIGGPLQAPPSTQLAPSLHSDLHYHGQLLQQQQPRYQQRLSYPSISAAQVVGELDRFEDKMLLLARQAASSSGRQRQDGSGRERPTSGPFMLAGANQDEQQPLLDDTDKEDLHYPHSYQQQQHSNQVLEGLVNRHNDPGSLVSVLGRQVESLYMGLPEVAGTSGEIVGVRAFRQQQQQIQQQQQQQIHQITGIYDELRAIDPLSDASRQLDTFPIKRQHYEHFEHL